MKTTTINTNNILKYGPTEDPQKLNILFAQFCYAGNGGIATVLPQYVPWMMKNQTWWDNDERVGKVEIREYGDIPLTMERNKVVLDAKRGGFDVIVMLDSDNIPDLYMGADPLAVPFMQSSFDFLYERKVRGVPTVVAAPYCGPPPHPVKGGAENVYVFYAESKETPEEGNPEYFTFEAYTREHAAIMRGIQPIAAGPTGCIMYSTDAFDLMPICGNSDMDILQDVAAGNITPGRAKDLLAMQSWFFYEFTDGYQTQKASTEDVTNTREIQLAGTNKHGEPVVFCNWDAWAGHAKPKVVGKPMPIRIEQVNEVYREAVRKEVSVEDNLVEVDFTANLIEEPEEPEVNDGTRDGVNPKVMDAIKNNSWSKPENEVEVWVGPAPDDKFHTRAVNFLQGSPILYGWMHKTPVPDLVELNAIVTNFVNRQGKDRKPLQVMEVGRWCGESTVAIAQGLNYGDFLYSCDPLTGNPDDWTGHIVKEHGLEHIESCWRKNKNLIPCRFYFDKKRLSLDEFEKNIYDIVFLDGDHSSLEIEAECAAARRMCSRRKNEGKKTLIMGHDYCDEFPGVQLAVDRFFPEAEVRPGTSLWVYES